MNKENLKNGRILSVIMMMFIFTLLGIPFYNWLHMLCSWIGWIFWPIWLTFTTALPVSYMIPWKRVQAIYHLIGECGFWGCIYIVIVYYLQAFILFAMSLFNMDVTDNIKIIAGYVALAISVILYAYGMINALFIRTVKLTIEAEITEKIRMAFLSDLHMGAYTTNGMIPRIEEAIKNISPDIILIAGDLFDMKLSELRQKTKKQADLIKLCSIADVYACIGNHDLIMEEPERDKWLKDCKIKFLRDESINYKGIDIMGRRDVRDSLRTPIEELKDKKSGLPLVILDHNPKNSEENFSLGAFLVLSGHTHGGQTFPGTIVQKIFMSTPVYGHIEKNQQHLIVTSGAGFWGPPLRIGVNNEIWCIDIVPKLQQTS